MVDLLFILHIITAVVLLLVTATYLVEFSYRHQNYPKIKDDKTNRLNNPDHKYKNLRIGKAANGAYYVGCQRWLIKKFISLIEDNNVKKVYEDEYKKIKDDDFEPGDYIGSPTWVYLSSQTSAFLSIINNLPYQNPSQVANSDETPFKYSYCTNEWFKWSASRFIPAILTLALAIIEILFALEKGDIVNGLNYGFIIRVLFFPWFWD
uniref:Uncharacterized protein n=1 Tax=Coptotermes formosanus TaxID=36987 RepID=R4V0H0_COPFO|nr:hypothetical protein [Coptotermes formosanus]